jgi:hypothetical protein
MNRKWRFYFFVAGAAFQVFESHLWMVMIDQSAQFEHPIIIGNSTGHTAQSLARQSVVLEPAASVT